MDKTNDIFFALLRSAIKNENEEISLADVDYEALFSLAKFHDLAHIVYYVLKKRDSLPEDEIGKKFKDQYDIAIYRHIRRTTAIAEVRKILENAHIPFILLKGVVLMDLYPEQWMRTSADIDVLVKEEDVKKVSKVFIESGMIQGEECPHHISFSDQNKMHIELHFCLIEEFYLRKTSELLKNIWVHSEMRKNFTSEHLMNDEWFYLYHIAHTAKHFKTGGCGVRSVLDVWFLNHKIQYDQAKRCELINESELFYFDIAIKGLSEMWFSKSETISLPDGFESYIINGGIYGTYERDVMIWKKKFNNRFIYYFKRIFLPYKFIKHEYSILKKWPVLLPFCWIARWFRLLKPEKRKQAIEEIRVENSIDSEESERIESLLKELEIW